MVWGCFCQLSLDASPRATALGLASRDNWQKQPQTMLQWRAISEACRVGFPDAICGLFTPEEIAEGVDLVETPSGIEVEAITQKVVDTSKVEEIKENLPSTDGANGLQNPLE